MKFQTTYAHVFGVVVVPVSVNGVICVTFKLNALRTLHYSLVQDKTANKMRIILSLHAPFHEHVDHYLILSAYTFNKTFYQLLQIRTDFLFCLKLYAHGG